MLPSPSTLLPSPSRKPATQKVLDRLESIHENSIAQTEKE
jgi:hypothetical protein